MFAVSLAIVLSLHTDAMSDASEPNYKYNGWNAGDSELPRPTTEMAVGYDVKSDTIWLLGGYHSSYSFSKQLVSFNNQVFHDHGAYNLSEQVSGSGQYYTQSENVLYLINSTHLLAFNLDTLHFEWIGRIPTKRPTDRYSCLTSYSKYLFIVGGIFYFNQTQKLPEFLDTLQIFNLTSMSWIDVSSVNLPRLNSGRSRLTCNVVNQKLYAIAGSELADPLQSIEVLFVGDALETLSNEHWQDIQALPAGCWEGRSFVYKNDIVISCNTEGHWKRNGTIFMIDTLTNNSSIAGYLNYSSWGSALITVGGIAYSFGGQEMGYDLVELYSSRWQYLLISSLPQSDSLPAYAFPTLMVNLSIIGVFLLFIIASKIDAQFCRSNDFYNTLAIIIAMVAVLDTVSDILFAIHITVKYMSQIDDIVYLVVIIMSYVCIVMPITLSLFQLWYEIRKHWISNDNVNAWLSTYSELLFLASIVCGSSFTAIEIVNCTAFKLDVFSMGLTKKDRIKYKNKRIWSIIFFENIPQVAIQIWYLLNVRIFDMVAIAAVVFSVTSIVITTLTIITQKTIIKNQKYHIISFEVTEENDGLTTAMSTKVNGIKQDVAILLGIKEQLIDMIEPDTIPQGYAIEIFIYKREINERLVTENELKLIFENNWNLNDSSLMISNLYCKVQSEKTQDNNASLSSIESAIDKISHPEKYKQVDINLATDLNERNDNALKDSEEQPIMSR